MKYFLNTTLIYVPLTLLTVISIVFFGDSLIAQAESLSDERNIYKTLGSENEYESTIPTNPMEFMRLIEKHNSMNEATAPSDAIDEALELFNAQSQESSTINN